MADARQIQYEVDQVWVRTSSLQDRVVWVGQGATRQRVRLIEIQSGGMVYRYLTNALDPVDFAERPGRRFVGPAAGG